MNAKTLLIHTPFMSRMLIFSTVSFTYVDFFSTHRAEKRCVELHFACRDYHDLIITANATGGAVALGI